MPSVETKHVAIVSMSYFQMICLTISSHWHCYYLPYPYGALLLAGEIVMLLLKEYEIDSLEPVTNSLIMK